MQLCAIGVAPKLLGVVATFHVYCARIPILLLAPHERPAFDQENALPLGASLYASVPPPAPDPMMMKSKSLPLFIHDWSRQGANPYAVCSRGR